MIHYTLRCGAEHRFDGWFKSSAAFESQVERSLVSCPQCGDTSIERGLMAPAIPRKGVVRTVEPAETAPQPSPTPPTPAETAANALPDQMRAVLQRIRAEVERTSDYVGPEFASEARRIHRGETEKRSIYGESTPEQAEALANEGIEVARIPWVKRADG